SKCRRSCRAPAAASARARRLASVRRLLVLHLLRTQFLPLALVVEHEFRSHRGIGADDVGRGLLIHARHLGAMPLFGMAKGLLVRELGLALLSRESRGLALDLCDRLRIVGFAG